MATRVLAVLLAGAVVVAALPQLVATPQLMESITPAGNTSIATSDLVPANGTHDITTAIAQVANASDSLPVLSQDSMNSAPQTHDVSDASRATYVEERSMPSPKELLIAVVTSPKHFSAREAIRQSYAIDAHESGRATVKFFVGLLPSDIEDREKVDARISAEQDMVRFSDYTESYHNLSYKALDIFKWAGDHGYRTVFKVDDDTYVRVPLVLEFLDNHNHDPYIYAGSFVDGSKAMVDNPKSKWYMKDQYPYDRLEDYANGPGILLGRRGIDFLRKSYKSLFRFRVDDAGLAIWLKDMPMDKTEMSVDHYSYFIHPETLWVNPVNSKEMLQLHAGEDFTPQVCLETCLCWGDPNPKSSEGCVTWDSFMNAQYQDMVPRLAFA